MGKATIISGGSDGLYTIQVNYDRSEYVSQINALNAYISEYTTTKLPAKTAEISAKISEINAAIIAGTDQIIINGMIRELDQLQSQKSALDLSVTIYQKRIAYLNDRMPDDYETSAWCADYTKTLSGVVATAEVPGLEITDNPIQIIPGFAGASWSKTMHGQLTPEVIMSPHQSYFNRAALPAVEKWRPQYRYGTITSLNESTDKANVTIETALSSQQDLDINQSTTLSSVDIDYMDCNSRAFNIGDVVLIKFTNQNWSTPKIVGFKDNPQPCCDIIIDVYTDFILDVNNTISTTSEWDYWEPNVSGASRVGSFTILRDYGPIGFQGEGYFLWRGGKTPFRFSSHYIYGTSIYFIRLDNNSTYLPFIIGSTLYPDQPGTTVTRATPTTASVEVKGDYLSASSLIYTPAITYPTNSIRLDFALSAIRTTFTWEPTLQLRSTIINQIVKGPDNWLVFDITALDYFDSAPDLYLKITTVQSGTTKPYWNTSSAGNHQVQLPNEDITDITFYMYSKATQEAVAGSAYLELKSVFICVL